MDKHKLKTSLLIISVIAGIATGTCILYYSQHIIIPYVLTGIICYLAAAGAIALLIMSRKGTEGKRYKKTAVATGIFNVVVAAAIVALILNACGIPLMPLRSKSRTWYGEFSYKEVMNSVDPSSPRFKTTGFVNTDEVEIEAYNIFSVHDRAKLELEENEDVYGVSYAKDNDVWRVMFGRIDKTTNYEIWFETVYLTGKGVTVLITFDE